MNEPPPKRPRMPALAAMMLQMFPEMFAPRVREMAPDLVPPELVPPALRGVPEARAVAPLFAHDVDRDRMLRALAPDTLVTDSLSRELLPPLEPVYATDVDVHAFRGWKEGGVNGFGRAACGGRSKGGTRTQKLKARKAQRQARAKQRR